MSFCEVACCRSSQNPNRKYHRFPIDTARFKEWLKILGKKSTDIKPSSAVCSKHFRFKDYYSGGKRLLPNAVPVLRLSNSPQKVKHVGLPSKKRKSEPNRQLQSLPKLVRKSLPNLKQKKEDKQSPKILKKILKSNDASNALKNKKPLKNILNAKNEKQGKETGLKPGLQKIPVRKTHLTNSKTSSKPLSRLCKRSSLSVRRSTLTQTRSSLPYKNSKKTPLTTKDKRRHSSISSFKRDKDSLVSKVQKSQNTSASSIKKDKDSSVSKVEKCPASLGSQSNKQLSVSCKLKNNDCKCVMCECNLENSKDSKQINSSSNVSSDSCIIEKSKPLERLNTTDERVLELKEIVSKTEREQLNATDEEVLETKEIGSKTQRVQLKKKDEKVLESKEIKSKPRRPIRKRKRLLSEDESGKGDDRPKVQKIKSNKPEAENSKKLSCVAKKELNKSGTSKNLSGIEKTISEMQNKIQMLEKKAILDEMKIESFKKALITQRNSDLKMLMDEKENELLLRMDLLYLDYDPRRICRLCLQLMDKKEDLIPLFWPLKNQALLSLIKQATNVEVEMEDGMPSSICGECLEEVRRVDWLKRRTHKSNMLIKKFVAMKKGSIQNNTDSSQAPDNMKPKSDDTPEEEVSEVFKIEDVFSLNNSPVMIFDSITIKQEPEYDEESEPGHELNTTYSIAVKKPRISRCSNCARTFQDEWLLKVHFQYCSKRFQCSECDKCFLNAASFRKHKQQRYACYCPEHLRHCSDCNISFRWKWQLVFHVLRHSTQVCKLCSYTVHSQEHLRHHLRVAHSNYSHLHLNNFLSLF